MKLKRNYYLVMLAVLTGLSSCEKDDYLYPQLGEDPRSLSEIASETEDISSFYQSVTEVKELDSILMHAKTYTVFAPNNTAFNEVSATGEELENILRNHLVNRVTADFSHTLSSGYWTTMAMGPNETNLSLYVDADGGEPRFNGMVSFVNGAYDMGSTNGVLHVVDGILVPPTVQDHLEANPDFSLLAEAVQIADISEFLGSTENMGPENPDYPITFFAPTDASFENLLTELNAAFGWANLGDIPVDVLQEILTYHVVTGANLLAAEVPETDQTTLQGEAFSITSGSTIEDASYSDANLSLTDIQGTNGVIHSIDKVLLPDGVFQSILDATQNIFERSEDRGYTTFVAAVEKAGLASTLESEELTVFAPNNDAFTALFDVLEDFESLDDFDTEEELDLLRSVLEYHLHSGRVLSSELTDGSLSTLQGSEITVDINAGSLQPSFEHAPNANLVQNNIGASNGVIHGIDNILVSEIDAEALGYPVPESAGPPPVFAHDIFTEEVSPGWWSGGWGVTKTHGSTEEKKSGLFSIKHNYTGGWGGSDFVYSGDAIDLGEYSTLHLSIFGTSSGSVRVSINGMGDNDQGVVLDVEEGEWTDFAIPFSEFFEINGAPFEILEDVRIQNFTGSSGFIIYVDDLGLM